MFRNREDAARKLAGKLRGRPLHDPLVLAIPRGGVAIGAVLAAELGAELDVVLVRKLRAPGRPELAFGAISEDGEVFLNDTICDSLAVSNKYLEQESRFQLQEIARRRKYFRQARPAARVSGRSIIVTDDGIATGSTMIGALKIIRGQQPREIIVAVPVAAKQRLQQTRSWCDDVVCLHQPEGFLAIGQLYDDFAQIGDEKVIDLLAVANSARIENGSPLKGELPC
jgi:putative phosphoribosyl transferase